MTPQEIKKELSRRELNKAFINAMLEIRLIHIETGKTITMQLPDVFVVFHEDENKANYFACVGKTILPWFPSLLGIVGFLEKYSEAEICECLQKFETDVKFLNITQNV